MPTWKEKLAPSGSQQKDDTEGGKHAAKSIEELIADMNRYSQEVLRKHEERIKLWR